MNLEEDQEVITLNEICRVCLIKNHNMKHLLQPNEDIIELITKLSSVSNVQIEINDILPSFLCNSCEEKLKISYDFQQLCQKSHQFLLVCLSDNSVSFKVNSFKPLDIEDTAEKSTATQLDNNSDAIISFIDNDGLEKKALVSYYSVSDIPGLTDNDNDVVEDVRGDVALKENQESTPESCLQMLDNLDYKDIEIIENEIKGENSEKDKPKDEPLEASEPIEVERRTKHKQSMRLKQFATEYVQKIMKKTKDRLNKHHNCIHCDFRAKNSKSLSVHMTRLHKEMRKNWCLWCNKIFENLKEHNNTIHKDDFKCPLCGIYKNNMGHFMEHLASHSTQRTFLCDKCDKSFISPRHLKMHLKVHVNEKLIQCHICLEVFQYKMWLSNHLRSHRLYKCKICSECFPSPEERKSHKCLSNKKESPPQNFCVKCNKRVRSLQDHINTGHGNPNAKEVGFKALCSYCGKGFRSSAKLTIHLRVHTGELPYKCQYCDKRASTRMHVIAHERTHTGEKPYSCRFCGKSFRQPSVLNTHLMLHTGKPNKCMLCYKSFCNPANLRLHMRSHTGERPYECKVCGQGFTQRCQLVKHSKRHSSNRPYKCDYCDKSFKYSYSLRGHLDIHLGRKPFKCPVCPYACRRSYSLKQHLLQHDSEPTREWYHKCDLCEQIFTSTQRFALHYTNDHGPSKPNETREDLIGTSSVVEVDHLQEFT